MKEWLRRIWTAQGGSFPPRLMLYLCEDCYGELLEWLEVTE